MELAEYKNIFDNEKSHFYYVGTHNAVLKFLNIYLSKKSGNTILDAGCGTGALMKKLNKFGEIWGIDASSEALKFAKQNKVRNIKKASVENIPFKDDLFDAVVSIDVLYHKAVKNDVRALSEFRRVLKPGGLLIVKSPAHNWLRGSHDEIIHTVRRYNKNELQERLKKVKFNTIKMSYINLFFLPFAVVKRISESLFNHKPESDVKPVPKIINFLLIAVYGLEVEILTKTSLPFGLSLFAIARKPIILN